MTTIQEKIKKLNQEQKAKQVKEKCEEFGLNEFLEKINANGGTLENIFIEPSKMKIKINSCPEDLLEMIKYLNFDIQVNQDDSISIKSTVNKKRFAYEGSSQALDGKMVNVPYYEDFGETLHTLISDWASDSGMDFTGTKYMDAINQKIEDAKLHKEYCFECTKKASKLLEQEIEERNLQRPSLDEVRKILSSGDGEEQISYLFVKHFMPKINGGDLGQKPKPEKVIFRTTTKNEIVENLKNTIMTQNSLLNAGIKMDGVFLSSADKINSDFKSEVANLSKKVIYTCDIDKILSKERMKELKEFIDNTYPFQKPQKKQSRKPIV